MRSLIAYTLLALVYVPFGVPGTFAVTPGNRVPITSIPDALLGRADVGERFCYDARCIVLATNPGHLSRLRALSLAGIISAEPLPNARKLFFPGVTYDLLTSSYDPKDFPGRDEYSDSAKVIGVVHFKSYAEDAWLEWLKKQGLTILEPIPEMGQYVFGDRSALRACSALSFVDGVLELPSGLKRWHLEEGEDPWTTEFIIVDLPITESRAKLAVVNELGALPPVSYRLAGMVAYDATISFELARRLSTYGETFWVSRTYRKQSELGSGPVLR